MATDSDLLIAEITTGEHDSRLDELANAVKFRRETLSQRKLREIKPGDTVRLNEGVSPKYLQGKTATVVSVEQKSVIVSFPLDANYRRFSGLQQVRCPSNTVDPT